MLNDIFVTKIGMAQVWTQSGKRLPITKCRADQNMVLTVKKISSKSNKNLSDKDQQSLFNAELAVGKKKHKNMTKPLRAQLTKSGFSQGATQIKAVKIAVESDIKVGASITASDVLGVGDVVVVRGVTKGKGFAGAVKRYGFAGGPKTHGQSDRTRAVGSIGAGTTPGRVWKGKKMPGRMGNQNMAVKNLVVVHIDPDTQEIWLSGPVPGHINSIVQITKTGNNRRVELHQQASGINKGASLSSEFSSQSPEAVSQAQTQESTSIISEPTPQAQTQESSSASSKKESLEDASEDKVQISTKSSDKSSEKTS